MSLLLVITCLSFIMSNAVNQEQQSPLGSGPNIPQARPLTGVEQFALNQILDLQQKCHQQVLHAQMNLFIAV